MPCSLMLRDCKLVQLCIGSAVWRHSQKINESALRRGMSVPVLRRGIGDRLSPPGGGSCVAQLPAAACWPPRALSCMGTQMASKQSLQNALMRWHRHPRHGRRHSMSQDAECCMKCFKSCVMHVLRQRCAAHACGSRRRFTSVTLSSIVTQAMTQLDRVTESTGYHSTSVGRSAARAMRGTSLTGRGTAAPGQSSLAAAARPAAHTAPAPDRFS